MVFYGKWYVFESVCLVIRNRCREKEDYLGIFYRDLSYLNYFFKNFYELLEDKKSYLMSCLMLVKMDMLVLG